MKVRIGCVNRKAVVQVREGDSADTYEWVEPADDVATTLLEASDGLRRQMKVMQGAIKTNEQTGSVSGIEDAQAREFSITFHGNAGRKADEPKVTPTSTARRAAKPKKTSTRKK